MTLRRWLSGIVLMSATAGPGAALPIASAPELSATVILLPVDPGATLVEPRNRNFYESHWVLTDSVTGTEEWRVAANDALPPGVRWLAVGFTIPIVSATTYLEVAVPPEGSTLAPGQLLLAVPLHPLVPSGTCWGGNFIIRETVPPVVLSVRSRLSAQDRWGRPLGRVAPSVTAYDERSRYALFTSGEDDRNVMTVNTAGTPATVVAGAPGGAGLVPLWADRAHHLTAAESRRRDLSQRLACVGRRVVNVAAAAIQVYLRPGSTPEDGEALCRSRGWKPLHLYRRRGQDDALWYTVLLPEGRDLCGELEAAGRLPRVARAEPVPASL